jgi:hypothetical protein
MMVKDCRGMKCFLFRHLSVGKNRVNEVRTYDWNWSPKTDPESEMAAKPDEPDQPNAIG